VKVVEAALNMANMLPLTAESEAAALLLIPCRLGSELPLLLELELESEREPESLDHQW
jgi:hypothetical protein